MIVGVVTVKLYAPWVHSLKEKRMVAKSIISKMQNKFNISVSEIGAFDTHQTLILGIACVAHSAKFSDSIINTVLAFIENNTEAEIVDIQREIR